MRAAVPVDAAAAAREASVEAAANTTVIGWLTIARDNDTISVYRAKANVNAPKSSTSTARATITARTRLPRLERA
jgi:hypothetical protein